MSERFKASRNVHDSKNTRLPIASEFGNYRFGRDALAHVHRYLFICEDLIRQARRDGPLRLLDVGCGDAYIARVLQSSFAVKKTEVLAQYTGLDIDDKSIERTRESVPKSFPIDLLVADITDGGLDQFADDEFDVLVCTEVIEHVQPRFVTGILKGFARVAKRGWISTPNWAGGSGRLPKDHVKEWTATELLADMKRAGVEVEETIGTFCQLAEVQRLAKQDESLREVYTYLKPRMDKHLLSLTMARFLGTRAQNVIYRCAFP